jgi:phospholipid/cholesterol/gamma-HCH transport system substrate-binding protein
MRSYQNQQTAKSRTFLFNEIKFNMKDRSAQNVKVGVLVIAGLIFLVLTLYMIGTRSNLFSNNFKVYATFKDIKGLLPGNNVRFSGITVGTISKVEIIKAGEVRVWMSIMESTRKHIKKNTLAAIGTDGLIGNKIVILTASEEDSDLIKSGDELATAIPFDLDETLRVLGGTNSDIEVIAGNIRDISEKLKNSQMIWTLLSDSLLGASIKSTINNVNQIGSNTVVLTRDLQQLLQHAKTGNGNLSILLNDTTLASMGNDLTLLMAGIKKGKGVMGTLLTDEAAANNIQETLTNIRALSDSLSYISNQLSGFSTSLNAGAKSINSVASDSIFLNNLARTMQNISNSTLKLDKTLEALKHNFLFRGSFKKMERAARKEDKAANK